MINPRKTLGHFELNQWNVAPAQARQGLLLIVPIPQVETLPRGHGPAAKDFQIIPTACRWLVRSLCVPDVMRRSKNERNA